jgi:hypothetical protein
MRQFLIIKSASDIEVLWQRRKSYRQTFAFIRVPRLAQGESRQLEARVNSYLRECGCSLGAKFMLLGFFVSTVWQFVDRAWSLAYWPGFLLRTFLVVLLAGAFGKSVGLMRAKFGMRRVVGRVREVESNSFLE